ncbi:hypothetical protein ACT7DE_17715 [Bacillus paranthracis]
MNMSKTEAKDLAKKIIKNAKHYGLPLKKKPKKTIKYSSIYKFITFFLIPAKYNILTGKMTLQINLY